MQTFTLVLFGASGDLTRRMVMPVIFRLARRGLLSPQFHVIGYARSAVTDDAFRARMRDAVTREARPGDEAAWTGFANRVSYLAGECDGDARRGYAELAHRLDRLDHGTGTGAGQEDRKPRVVRFSRQSGPLPRASRQPASDHRRDSSRMDVTPVQ